MESNRTPLDGFRKVYSQSIHIICRPIQLAVLWFDIVFGLVPNLMMSGAPILVILICMSSLYSGLEILHQREGLITEAECERIGSTRYYDRCTVVIRIITAKSISESLKIRKICEQYQLLGIHYINQIRGMSVCDLCVIHVNLYNFPWKWYSNYLCVHYLITLYCVNFGNC